MGFLKEDATNKEIIDKINEIIKWLGM